MATEEQIRIWDQLVNCQQTVLFLAGLGVLALIALTIRFEYIYRTSAINNYSIKRREIFSLKTLRELKEADRLLFDAINKAVSWKRYINIFIFVLISLVIVFLILEYGKAVYASPIWTDYTHYGPFSLD